MSGKVLLLVKLADGIAQVMIQLLMDQQLIMLLLILLIQMLLLKSLMHIQEQVERVEYQDIQADLEHLGLPEFQELLATLAVQVYQVIADIPECLECQEQLGPQARQELQVIVAIRGSLAFLV